MDRRISKERVKYLAKLHQKKFRLEEDLVIVEGANIIEQLIQNGYPPLEIYHTEETPLPHGLGGTNCLVGDDAALERICDTKTPQGIAGLYHLPAESEGEFRTALYLDGIADPGNLGTIFRTAAAFGIDTILLSEDCTEVASPKVIRASLGSVFWLRHKTLTHSQLLSLGASKYCLIMEGKIPLNSFQPSGARSVYLIGSEAHGVSPELISRCDGSLRIAMAEGMESLNAAVASAILAHHLYIKQRISDECD
ncbi:MAG TPA: RNA methyltransferase [Candidatus Cloacimonadota bacterium]|nr:RNA methyltransferase [Candidatus Cloacimonadota bacterium]